MKYLSIVALLLTASALRAESSTEAKPTINLPTFSLWTKIKCMIGLSIYKPLIPNNIIEIADDAQFEQEIRRLIPEANFFLYEKEGKPSAEANSLADEDKRAMTGIKAYHWLRTGNYEKFTECQADAVKLSRERFNYWSHFIECFVNTHALQDAIIYFLAINDFGKADSIKKLTHEENHDVALKQLVKHYPEKLPTWSKLAPEARIVIQKILDTGLNFSQFVQLEAPAADLQNFTQLSDSEKRLLIAEAVLDMMGAGGAFKSNGSLSFTEPAAQTFTLAKSMLLGLKTQDATFFYGSYLNCRALLLGLVDTFSSSSDTKTVALTRMSAMARCITKQDAEKIGLFELFEKLPQKQKDILLVELNKDGITDRAIKVEYAPALFNNVKPKGIAGTEAALNILANIFAAAQTYAKDAQTGVFEVHANDIAVAAKNNPERLVTKKIIITKLNTNEAIATFEK